MRTKIFLRARTAILAAFMLLVVGFAGIAPAFAFNNEVKSGTVAVVFYLKDAGQYITDGQNFQRIGDLGDIQLSHGSGFFVGATSENPQYVVTNCHVINDYVNTGEGGTYLYNTGSTYQGYPLVIGATSCELRIYYSQDDYDIAYVDCYGDVDKVDLAVLRLRTATEKRHALQIMVPTEDMVGDTVYTVGFPGNADNVLTGASKYGVDDATVYKGSINRFVASEGVGVERIAVDATIHPGNSGGPLVTEEGYVIGINTNHIVGSTSAIDIQKDYYSINSSELVRFLDKNSIPYELAGTKSGGGVLTGVIIAVVVIIVILAAGAAAAFFIISNKKKTQAVPAAAVVRSSGPKAIVRSMSPQHVGKAFPVGGAPMMIGRDPAVCAIVFQEGTRGVSGKHCSVSYNAATNTFTLTDLGSTYGTFLGSGMKLTANTPVNLRPGDIFYIGDKANILKVEVEQ